MSDRAAPAGQWCERRKEYRYGGVLFSEDGARLRLQGIEYRERPFPARAERQFRYWLAACVAFIFPGIPLLAHWGLNGHLPWLAGIFGLGAYWLHGRIHVCPGCGGRSRTLSTPYMGSPVLYLCRRCRTFFEHGQIDGGWPWK